MGKTMKTNNTSAIVLRNGGTHIALMIMKMVRGPVTLDELTEINPVKLSSTHRKKYADYLVSNGYARVVDENPTRYQITRAGIDKVYSLAGKPPRD